MNSSAFRVVKTKRSIKKCKWSSNLRFIKIASAKSAAYNYTFPSIFTFFFTLSRFLKTNLGAKYQSIQLLHQLFKNIQHNKNNCCNIWSFFKETLFSRSSVKYHRHRGDSNPLLLILNLLVLVKTLLLNNHSYKTVARFEC